MQREINLPVLIAAAASVLLLLGGFWYFFLGREPAVDPALERKARELRQRRHVPPPR